VALGGAYAEPESETAAAVSKIIRNVMARLHGEINRSISVYRAQQKGNRPVKLYLTGGSSTMTYTDHFFAEKLRMDVEYLNPFGVVQLGPEIDRGRLEEVAHMFSEVIGLGLRYRMSCPIEVSLVPESITRQQALRRKKPYLVFSMIFFCLIFAVAWRASAYRRDLYESARRTLDKQRTAPEILQTGIKQAQAEMEQKNGQFDSVVALLSERARYPRAINKLHELKPSDLWLVSIVPIVGEMPAVATGEDAGGPEGGGGMFGGASEGASGGMFGGGSGGGMGMGMGMGMEGDMGGGMGGGMGATGPTLEDKEITGFRIIGHSVNFRDLQKKRAVAPTRTVSPQELDQGALEGDESGEPEVIDMTGTPESMYLTAIRKSEYFDSDKTYTEFVSYYPPKSVKNLASFVIQVKLKEPIPFQEVTGSTSTGAGGRESMMSTGF
jgi:hypothetical protein